MKILLTFVISLVAALSATAQTLDLSGTWQFAIDRTAGAPTAERPATDYEGIIALPASMLERGLGDDITTETQWIGSLYDSSYFHNPHLAPYRQPGNMKLTFFLTPDKHYVGKAWYRRTFNMVKPDTKNCRYILHLERPHIQTTLFVNGKEAGSQRSLCVPHDYDITPYVKNGENSLAICIDNRIETVGVGQDSHSVSDQTQGDWNGIVGSIELRTLPLTHITDIQVFPDLAQRTAHVRIAISGKAKTQAVITLSAEAFNTSAEHRVPAISLTHKLLTDNDTVTMDLPMGNGMLMWDEFSPALYRLKAQLKGSKGVDKRESVFGMREITIRDRMFYVNGREIQLRGTVENCDFPLTGYAPMDLNAWIRVFQRCKAYGLNHMRFHSYCPPEAAFLAADMVGFYIQPEGPSWPNHGVKLGYGQDIDSFLMDETKALSREYGNHPSFCFLACGNEPAGRWVEWCSQFVDYWVKADSRRLYTGASVGGGWAWQPRSQYHVKAGARGLADWNKSAPQSMDDYRAQIAHYKAKDLETDINEPYVSHETGQWCVFPNFNETKKYTGPYKARNFEVFRDILEQNGMGSRAQDFFMASGKLQALCYKYEIEKTLRTPNYAGFQLLGLNDYSGQGTALVGVTDVFFDEKPYCTATDFSEFCSPVVPLARIPKFTYTNEETFSAHLELNNHSTSDIAALNWAIIVAEGKVIDKGVTATEADITCSLSGIRTAQKLTLDVTTANGEGHNHWNFWVFPATAATEPSGILITDTLDAKAIRTLQKGGKVLITAAGRIRYGNDVVQQFLPVFWNTSWFKMRPPHTTGLFVESDHAALSQFPTDSYSDLQWWELCNRAQVMQLSEFPTDFQPIVQSIDTWFVSRKVGMLFEAKVLNGRLMMTTMDLTSDLAHRHAARQMRSSLLSYMASEAFQPKYTIDTQLIEHLFTETAPAIDMFTNDSPDELKPKLK